MNPETEKSHREKQCDTCLRLREKQGLTQLGSMANGPGMTIPDD